MRLGLSLGSPQRICVVQPRSLNSRKTVILSSLNLKPCTLTEHHSQNDTFLTVKRLIFRTFYFDQ